MGNNNVMIFLPLFLVRFNERIRFNGFLNASPSELRLEKFEVSSASELILAKRGKN